MSKHHVMCKSKTLDVPIIITSSIDIVNDYSCENEDVDNGLQQNAIATSNNTNNGKYKLDKGLSLDSHCLKTQNSLSSNSTNNDLTASSSTNSVSSSTSSNLKLQFQNQKFLSPPASVKTSYNINADFTLNYSSDQNSSN